MTNYGVDHHVFFFELEAISLKRLPSCSGDHFGFCQEFELFSESLKEDEQKVFPMPPLSILKGTAGERAC